MRLFVCAAFLLTLGACPPRQEPTPPPQAPLIPRAASPTSPDVGDDLDRDDRCPDRGEDEDGYQDGDGCPDRDNDRDGIDDVADQCPDVPAPDDPDKDGCPTP